MDGIRSYLLQVISSALICGILIRLMGKKGLLTEAAKLLAGVYMTITVLSPWVNIRLGSLQDITGNISIDAQAAAQVGKNSAKETISEIIKERTRTYILDKATSLGVTISVDVMLNEDTVPYPTAVTLTGRVSPYAKSILTAYIVDNFGISSEDQTWIA